MRIEILGTPFNGLGSPPDIENPAEGLREAELVWLLESSGHRVTDLGDLSGFQFQGVRDPETGIKDYAPWIELSRSLAVRLGEILDRGSFPLLLGGDCSMLVGVLSAHVSRGVETGLLFLDGHADFHSPETSPTGDPADMELAVLTGRGPEGITRIGGTYPLLKEENIVVYGIRAWDHIGESDIRVYGADRLREKGIPWALEEGLEGFIQKGLPLWLHFDVDVLDPEIMPVMFPEPGGLRMEEAEAFLRIVFKSVRVAGMSIACYHPALDVDGGAGARLAALISDVLAA